MGAAKLWGNSRSRAYASSWVRDIASVRVLSGGGQLKLPLSPVYVWEFRQFGPIITVHHVFVAEEDNWVRAVVVVRLSEYVAVHRKEVQGLNDARPYCCAIERSEGAGKLGAERTVLAGCCRGRWV